MFNFLKKKEVVDFRFNTAWTSGWGEYLQYTPDMVMLERKEYHRFFIPDEMLYRHWQHKLLGDCGYICHAFTQQDFSLWKKNRVQVSVAIPLDLGYITTPSSTIRGELYSIKTSQIPILDTYKMNGVEFERIRVKLLIPFRPDPKAEIKDKATYDNWVAKSPYLDKTIDAWMYVGIKDYWESMLDGGFLFEPVRLYTPNNSLLKKYYYLTLGEYEPNHNRETRTVLRMR